MLEQLVVGAKCALGLIGGICILGVVIAFMITAYKKARGKYDQITIRLSSKKKEILNAFMVFGGCFILFTLVFTLYLPSKTENCPLEICEDQLEYCSQSTKIVTQRVISCEKKFREVVGVDHTKYVDTIKEGEK